MDARKNPLGKPKEPVTPLQLWDLTLELLSCPK